MRAAAARLEPFVHRTPCLRSRTFSALSGGDVWLKYENLQRTGSYKIRGALNRVLTLPESARAAGVIAASAGNHAQGVAVAAQLAGVPCYIVMPRQAPLAKVAATRGYGAKVVLHGDVFDDAHAEALRLAAAERLTYVHPFDDAAVMAGQGTVADAADIDTLVVPIGGGGLIAGCAIAARALRPDIKIIGVQASGANATYLAFHSGLSGPLESAATIADGVLTRAPGEHTLPIIRSLVDDVVTVSDEAIAETVVLLLERAKTVSEPAGAVALAALLSGAVTLASTRPPAPSAPAAMSASPGQAAGPALSASAAMSASAGQAAGPALSASAAMSASAGQAAGPAISASAAMPASPGQAAGPAVSASAAMPASPGQAAGPAVSASAAMSASPATAAARAGRVACAIISGGNVDPGLVDRLLQFGLGAAGRHLRLRTELPDRPGALTRLSAVIAEQGANIFEVIHHRVGASPSLNAVDLELTLEVRDRAHGTDVLAALRDHGYRVERLNR